MKEVSNANETRAPESCVLSIERDKHVYILSTVTIDCKNNKNHSIIFYACCSTSRRSNVYLRAFSAGFAPGSWSTSSTGVLTSVLEDTCTTSNIEDMSNETCPGNIQVLFPYRR